MKVKKKCLNCGAPVKKNASKYCGNKCQNEYQEKEKLRKWLTGEIKGYCKGGSYTLYQIVKEYIFEQADNKCEECGFDDVNPFTGNRIIQIDHTDGDASNDRPENLKVLCPNCHAKTNTFGNIGGRQSARRDHRKKTRTI